MLDNITSNIKGMRSLALYGALAVVALLLISVLVLFLYLPSADTFNTRVEQIFIENDALRTTEAVKLLEILAQSGTTFADVLQSYRFVIFVLLVLTSALLLSVLFFLIANYSLSRRVSEIERVGMIINSLIVNREEQVVEINSTAFELTEAACETLSVLCEARMDDEVVSGVDIESMITGKDRLNCEEAAGATRIKRLRDSLGNQIVSNLLVKNISRKGYMLSIDKDVIRVV